MKCPVNCLLVELESAYQDVVLFESGVKLFKDVSWNPEWNTTCTGKILSVPTRLQQGASITNEYEGMVIDGRVGDTVIFSYQVIEDKIQRENDTPIHKNQFLFEGKYYWKVDMAYVLGYVREGKLVPACGNVFLRDIPKEEVEKVGSLYIPEMSRTGRKGNRAEVISVGEPKKETKSPSIETGDIIIYNDRYAQRYDVTGFGEIIVVGQSYIAAVETLSKAA